MRIVPVLAIAASAAGCGGEPAAHEHAVISQRPAPGEARPCREDDVNEAGVHIHRDCAAEARIRELTGAVTLEWWQATPDRFRASVTTRVGAIFWVMAGRCNADGDIAVHEARIGDGPPTIDLPAGTHDVVEFPLVPIDGRGAPAPESWYFEITAHDGAAALAQQIYSSGTCLANARQPSNSRRDSGLLYFELPPAKP